MSGEIIMATLIVGWLVIGLVLTFVESFMGWGDGDEGSMTLLWPFFAVLLPIWGLIRVHELVIKFGKSVRKRMGDE